MQQQQSISRMLLNCPQQEHCLMLAVQASKWITLKKIAELKLAAHIACHSSIATVDHLGEIVKNISGKDISLHKTKCSALIKKALSPAVHDEFAYRS